MSSEDRESDLVKQLKSFAITLEGETGEPIRPVPQRLNTGVDIGNGVDVGTPRTLTLVPSRRTRRHWLLPAVAGTATIIVVVGGLVALSNDATPADDPAPAESADPTPATSGAPPSTVVGEVADSDSSVAPGSTLAPAPTTAAPATAAPTTVSAPVTSWRGGLLADIEVEALLPLASVSDGNFVVPTAPVDWRILSGGFGTHPAGFSNSAVTVVEARPDGTTGPWIEVAASILGICVDRGVSNCETSGDSTEINGVVWQPFTELDGARGKVGDLFIDVLVNDPELTGPVLNDALILEYLDGLRVGTGDDYWDTLRIEVGQACWICSDEQDDGGPTQAEADEADAESSDDVAD